MKKKSRQKENQHVNVSAVILRLNQPQVVVHFPQQGHCYGSLISMSVFVSLSVFLSIVTNKNKMHFCQCCMSLSTGKCFLQMA